MAAFFCFFFKVPIHGLLGSNSLGWSMEVEERVCDLVDGNSFDKALAEAPLGFNCDNDETAR